MTQGNLNGIPLREKEFNEVIKKRMQTLQFKYVPQPVWYKAALKGLTHISPKQLGVNTHEWLALVLKLRAQGTLNTHEIACLNNNLENLSSTQLEQSLNDYGNLLKEIDIVTEKWNIEAGNIPKEEAERLMEEHKKKLMNGKDKPGLTKVD